MPPGMLKVPRNMVGTRYSGPWRTGGRVSVWSQSPEALGGLLSEEGAHHTSARVKFAWNGTERARVCAEAELENLLSCWKSSSCFLCSGSSCVAKLQHNFHFNLRWFYYLPITDSTVLQITGVGSQSTWDWTPAEHWKGQNTLENVPVCWPQGAHHPARASLVRHNSSANGEWQLWKMAESISLDKYLTKKPKRWPGLEESASHHFSSF